MKLQCDVTFPFEILRHLNFTSNLMYVQCTMFVDVPHQRWCQFVQCSFQFCTCIERSFHTLYKDITSPCLPIAVSACSMWWRTSGHVNQWVFMSRNISSRKKFTKTSLTFLMRKNCLRFDVRHKRKYNEFFPVLGTLHDAKGALFQ